MDEDCSTRRYMAGEAISAFYEEQEIAAAAITEDVKAHACSLIELAIKTADCKAA
jgi:predicted transcriptional regulator